jgi:hypothetical protein
MRSFWELIPSHFDDGGKASKSFRYIPELPRSPRRDIRLSLGARAALCVRGALRLKSTDCYVTVEKSEVRDFEKAAAVRPCVRASTDSARRKNRQENTQLEKFKMSSNYYPTINLHIADQATKIWKIDHPKTHFGNTHHTFTPTQWAMQALSLNISHALANAIATALQDRLTATVRQPISFRGPTPHAFLHRPSAYRTAAAPPNATRLASTFTW